VTRDRDSAESRTARSVGAHRTRFAFVAGGIVIAAVAALFFSSCGSDHRSTNSSTRITVNVNVTSRQIDAACIVTTNNVFGSYPVNGANSDTMVPLNFPNGESYAGLDVALPWHGRLTPYNKDAGLNVAVYPVPCPDAVTRSPIPTDVSCEISLSNNSPSNTHIDFAQAAHTAYQNPQGNDGTAFCWIPPAGQTATTEPPATDVPAPTDDTNGSAITDCSENGINDVLRRAVEDGSVASVAPTSTIAVNCEQGLVGILYQGYDGTTDAILARQSDGTILAAGTDLNIDNAALVDQYGRALLSDLLPGQFGTGA
jgi:hypothetical protein